MNKKTIKDFNTKRMKKTKPKFQTRQVSANLDDLLIMTDRYGLKGKFKCQVMANENDIYEITIKKIS